MRSGGLSRKANPRARVSRSGKAKTQKTASGSRMNSLKRAMVSSASGERVFSGIAQLPPGQRHEEILQSCSVCGESPQFRVVALDQRDELRHRVGQGIDAQEPAVLASRAPVKAGQS